jgi:hypothetical protein
MDDAQISDNKFSRFDDELIEKYFNDKGKKAIQDYIASYTNRAVEDAVKIAVNETTKLVIAEMEKIYGNALDGMEARLMKTLKEDKPEGKPNE